MNYDSLYPTFWLPRTILVRPRTGTAPLVVALCTSSNGFLQLNSCFAPRLSTSTLHEPATTASNHPRARDYSVTFSELRNRGDEGLRCNCSCRLPKDRMQQQLTHSSDRFLAMGLAAVSAAAMLYVGLYQSRAVRHLWCPVFKKGCEAVADAAFAKPFGIPDGYIAVALYLAMILLLLGPVEKLWIWIPVLILASLATLANFLGVRDMANLGSFCFYCMVTTALSPVLLWATWRLR